jgi:hypothetical protein
VIFAQARMIKTKSKIISQDKEITNTLKKNIFPNPTHLPVHCNFKNKERGRGGKRKRTRKTKKLRVEKRSGKQGEERRSKEEEENEERGGREIVIRGWQRG